MEVEVSETLLAWNHLPGMSSACHTARLRLVAMKVNYTWKPGGGCEYCIVQELSTILLLNGWQELTDGWSIWFYVAVNVEASINKDEQLAEPRASGELVEVASTVRAGVSRGRECGSLA